MDSPAGESCRECSGTGCKIQETKDDRCKEFECSYFQAPKANIALRPDNCGVIYERIQDDIMFGTMDITRSKYTHLNGQVKAFLDEGFNVVLSRKGVPVIHTLEGISAASVMARLT
jgi:hypothetical protein